MAQQAPLHFVYYSAEPADKVWEGFVSGKAIDPPEHGFEWHGHGSFVIFVAIGAIQIAASDGHDMCQNRVRGRLHGTNEHSRLAEIPAEQTNKTH